jgi:WD40 repeat protein
VGGKGQGNDLKLYDVETQKVAYKAKPPPENWLGYRAPPYVSAIEFVPGSENRNVLVGTGERVVRLYDTRADKRAVMDLSVGETTITALAMDFTGAYAFIGNAKGQLQTVDLRAKGVFAKFKGVSGSIREIAPHPTEPLIAVAGLDRYLRVYDTESRKCLGSAFMKQALSGCAWDVRGPEIEFAAAAAEVEAKRSTKRKENSVNKASSEKKTKKKVTSEKKPKGKTKRSGDVDDSDVVPLKKKKKEKVDVP